MNKYEKAIRYFQSALSSAAKCSDEYIVKPTGYFEINTALEALGKQMPKKVKTENGYFECPYCQTDIEIDKDKSYCVVCGQALDWSCMPRSINHNSLCETKTFKVGDIE